MLPNMASLPIPTRLEIAEAEERKLRAEFGLPPASTVNRADPDLRRAQTACDRKHVQRHTTVGKERP
jgi:hypothetical protein